MVPALSFGNSMVIAPHPDDETLGCGGTVALLLEAGKEVSFVFVSDGTLSHPNSQKYPVSRLRALRETEALNAVLLLGGQVQHVDFLALPDRHVPDEQSPYFEAIVEILIGHIKRAQPDTIFIPWQNDPHPDHRASYQILTAAVAQMEIKPRLVQYPIWLWEMGTPEDVEVISKMNVFCVDINQTLQKKINALYAHKSQITDLIDDDPTGFRLSAEMIAHFSHGRELFFETK